MMLRLRRTTARTRASRRLRFPFVVSPLFPFISLLIEE